MEFIQSISKELVVIFISALPVGELRASIPFALFVYKFSLIKAFLLSIFGNMIPAILILKLMESVSLYFIKNSICGKKFFEWLFVRTRKKFNHHYDKYGVVALFIFVAIPLPFTGVWTASIGAFLLGIKSKSAIPYLAGGVIIAGLIVSIMSLFFGFK